MRKIKKLGLFLLIFIEVIAIWFTFGGLSSNAANGTVTFHYSVYTKETWEAYQNGRIMDENFALHSIKELRGWITEYDGITQAARKKVYWNSKIKNYYSPNDCKKNSDGTFWDDGTGYGDLSNADAVTISLGSDSDTIRNNLEALIQDYELSDSKKISQAVPGDALVVVVNAEVSATSTIRQAQVLLDVAQFAQGGTSGIDVYKAEGLAGYTVLPGNVHANIGREIGWVAGTGDVGTATPNGAFVGAIGFTVASGASGNMKIEYAKKDSYTVAAKGATMFTDGDLHSLSSNARQNSDQFIEDNCVISVAGLSDDTNLTELTVEGQSCLSTATSVSINGQNTSQYKGKEVTDGQANVSVTVASSGKLVAGSVKYGSSLSSQTSSATVSGSNFSIDMSSMSSGETIIATFQVESSSGNGHQWYAVELTKARDTNCNLDSLGFSGKDGAANANIKISPDFNSSKTAYTLYVPKGTTDLKFRPVVSDSIRTITAKYNTGTAASVASGTDYSVPTWANGGKVTITVTAQSGATKDYVITLSEVNLKPNKVTVTSGSFTGNDVDADGDNHFVINNLPYACTTVSIGSLASAFANKSIIQSVRLYQGSTASTQNILTQNVSFNIPASTGAHTETIRMEVTSTSGNVATYYVDINRLAPNSDNSLGSVSIIANNGSDTTICNSFSGTNLTITYPGGASELPFNFNNFKITATPSNSLSRVEIKINNNVQSTYSFTGGAAQSIPVSIKVTAEDGTSTTYTGTVKRGGADNDQTFTLSNLDYNYTDASGTLRSGNYSLAPLSSDPKTYSNPTTLLPFRSTSASFKVIPNASTTKIYIDGIDYTNKIYTTNFSNTSSIHNKRVKVIVKSEYDETTYPNDPNRGYELWFDIECEAPDNTMNLTSIDLLSSSSGTVISNSSNTTQSGKTYTYILKESEVGSTFKLNLTWDSATTEAYVSTNNSSSITNNVANKYDPNKTWSIGTKVYIYLKAESGNSIYYIVDTQFADERSTENGIQNVIFKDGSNPLSSLTFNESITTYPSSGTIKVPYSVQRINAEIQLKHARETLVAGSGYISAGTDANLWAKQTITLKEGLNTLKVQGMAENGQKGTTYTFNIEREAGSTHNAIETLFINSIDCADTSYLNQNFDYAFNRTDSNFSFYVPRGTGNINLVFTVSLNASFTISSSKGDSTSSPYAFSITDGEVVKITINVKSEVEVVTGKGTGKTYNITIYSADTDSKLDDLDLFVSDSDLTDLLDVSNSAFTFNPDVADQGTFTIPFKSASGLTTSAYFLPSKVGFNGTVQFDSTTLSALSAGYTKSLSNPSTYPVTIRVTSELGKLAASDSKIKKADKEFTYTLKIVRNAGSSNAFLSSLEVFVDGSPATFTNKGTPQVFTKTLMGPYMVENVLASSSTISINATAEDSKATITGDGNQNISLAGTTTTQIFVIHVVAEDGKTTNDYRVQLWTTQANPDTDKTLNLITATSTTDATTNKLTPTFRANVKQYSIHLSSTEDGAVLNFTKNSNKSTLYIVGGMDYKTVTDLTSSHTVPVSPSATVIYTIYLTAEDGSSTESDPYEITISRDAASTDATLDTFKINGKTVTGFESGKVLPQYTVHIGDAADFYFEGTTKDPNATISNNPAPTTARLPLNVGSNIHVLTTTAQDGKTTCTYTVNIIKDAPKELDDLRAEVTVDGVSSNYLTPTFVPTMYRGYKVALTYDQDSMIITYDSSYVTAGNNTVTVLDQTGKVIPSASSSINVTGIPVGTTLYTVRVTAASGAKADYEIAVTRETGSDDNSIVQYEYLAKSSDSSLTSLPINASSVNYKYTVGRDIILFDPQITTSDPNAKVELPEDLTLTPGQLNIKRVTVVSQTGKKKIYTFSIYPCDTNFDIDDINALVAAGGADVLDVDGSSFIDYENNNLSITVANSTSQTYLEVLGGGSNSAIYMNGKKYTNQIVNLKEGLNTFVFYIKSEYGEVDSAATNAQSPSVTITITRKAKSTDSTLKELSVTYVDAAGISHTIDHSGLPGNSPLAIPNIGENITSVTISATPNDPTATVLGTGARDLNDKDQAIFNFTVKCTAEDGTSTDYPIKIARGPIDVDKDNTLTYIEVSDGTGTKHLDQTSFNLNTTTYGTYHIPFDAQNYTVTVVKPGYSPSIVLIDNQTVASGTRTTTILDSDRGTTKTITVQIQAQDGTKGQEYTIELEFDAPSDDAKLSELKADGALVPGFDPTAEGGEYTLATRPNTTETILIEYTPADPKSKVAGDTGTLPLKEGMNTFVIIVTSEGGTENTYRILVQRDTPAPYLTDLVASGEQLLNTNYKATTFDKDVFEYTSIVTYMTLHATINASVDNQDHTVSCSNSQAILTSGLLRSFNVDLVEGLNRFSITVTSKEGKSSEYIFTIKRLGEASAMTDVSNITIDEVPVFKDKFNEDILEYPFKDYGFVVPNGIHDLTVHVNAKKQPDANGDGAKVQIFNDKNLQVGKNTVVVLITAEDGVNMRAVLIDVEREPMKYVVDEKAYENFECVADKDDELVYSIDLGNKLASDIKDYTKYIHFDEEYYSQASAYGEIQLPEVTVLSDTSDKNCNEVVLRLYDGSDEKFVRFKLQSTAFGQGSGLDLMNQIIPWGFLGLAIILLIIILICVNRDKYGAINKRRKKDQD